MEMSLPQLEQIFEGISKLNQKTQEAVDGNTTSDAHGLLAYLDANGGEI